MADAAPEVKTDEVCRMFRNTGRCRFGAKCRYQHTEGEPIEVPERPVKPRGICYAFQKGEPCKYADRCKFFHGTEAEAVTDASDREKARQEKKANAAANKDGKETGSGEKSPRKRRPRRKGKKTDGDAEATSTPRPPVVDEFDAEGKVVCRNFKTRGRCRFAGRCTYSHNVTPDAQPAAKADGDAKTGGRARRIRRKPNTCFSWRDSQTCQYGDECRFKHGDDDTRDLAARKRPRGENTATGVCYNWRDQGTCTRDNCRFSHEAPTESP